MAQLFNSIHQKLFVQAKSKQSSRVKKQESLSYAYGSQDTMDLLSYAGLEESETYVVIDDTYIRTLFISGFPYIASTGWLNMLINFNHNIDISYHLEQVDAALALPKLTRKITELESTKRAMQRRGAIIGSEITDPLESAVALKNKIQRGQEKLFQISIYIALSAPSLSELHKMTTLLETVLAARLFYTKIATFQQLEGLQSVLPRAENLLAQKRNLDSSSAALTFPFVSSELVQDGGILYGVNRSNNSLVILDRFSLHNANSIVFAQSGSGKSYTAKVEILRQLMQGTKVIVIDPEREYEQLTKSVHGTYIRLSAHSKEKINLFDLSITTTDAHDDNLATHVQDLTDILSLMLDGLSAEEKGVLDKAIMHTYKGFGWTLTKSLKRKKDFPLLKDLHKTLKTMKQRKLASRLEKYTKGSLSQVFDSQTNISVENRLIVFDIKDLSESLRQIMLVVISNFVYNQVICRSSADILRQITWL